MGILVSVCVLHVCVNACAEIVASSSFVVILEQITHGDTFCC